MSAKGKQARPSDWRQGKVIYTVSIHPDAPFGCVVETIYKCHLIQNVKSITVTRNDNERVIRLNPMHNFLVIAKALHRVSDEYVAESQNMLTYSANEDGSDCEFCFTTAAAARRFAINMIKENTPGIVVPEGFNLADTLIKMMARSRELYVQKDRDFISHLVTQDTIDDLLDDVPVGTAGEHVQNNSVADKLW